MGRRYDASARLFPVNATRLRDAASHAQHARNAPAHAGLDGCSGCSGGHAAMGEAAKGEEREEGERQGEKAAPKEERDQKSKRVIETEWRLEQPIPQEEETKRQR